MKCFLIHRATDVNIILRMGSLSSAQYSTFHDISRNSSSWVYLRGDTAFWALDHTEVLVYGSYRGECHSFHLFSHGNCNSVHLSGISLTHYRTMLVVIPFFPFCNLKKKKKKGYLLIKIGFDHIWGMQWWNKRKYQGPGYTCEVTGTC